MKQYPKTYKDLSHKPGKKIISNIGSSLGSVDNLANRFRSFSREAHLILFDLTVKEVWLEQHFLYDGARRLRSKNGYSIDWAFSYFMNSIVGISQKTLTQGIASYAIPTYFIDFFPNFIDHDPFDEPEYFKYPYKHITLDFLMFIYQYRDRLELLKEAEEKKMNINDFINWASNYIFCRDDEEGEEKHRIVRSGFFPYISKVK
jgi:hypothetical protein